MDADAAPFLVRTGDRARQVDALAERLGGRVGLSGVLGDLDRRVRRSWAPGRAVRRALAWDAADQRDRRWWPQGVSTSADASADGRVLGRRLLAVTWYARDLGEGSHGSRLTFVDLESRRYRHVLLVEPTPDHAGAAFTPLVVHAGGLVWHGPYLHVAATWRGFVTCHVDDVLRLPGGATAYGHHYVLPVRQSYRARTPEGTDRLRYSFMSLDRSATPARMVVGEYGNSRQPHRLADLPIDAGTLLPAEDDAGVVRPLDVVDGGVVHAQGAVVVDGTWYLTASQSSSRPGLLYAGRPGSFRRIRWAMPMGPEDLAAWPGTDELWTVTEHPWRRWILTLRRPRP